MFKQTAHKYCCKRELVINPFLLIISGVTKIKLKDNSTHRNALRAMGAHVACE
jgi:hypothetical protein